MEDGCGFIEKFVAEGMTVAVHLIILVAYIVTPFGGLWHGVATYLQYIHHERSYSYMM